MFCRKNKNPLFTEMPGPEVAPEMFRAYADRIEREAAAKREHILKLALGELKSGRFRFPMADTPILLAHLVERIEALEKWFAPPALDLDKARIGGSDQGLEPIELESDI